MDEFRILLPDNSIDVLAINETRLDSSICDCELFIPGGGVCFYVRSTINHTRRLDLNIDHLENLCIEIRKPCAKPFLVITWYRQPDSTVDKFSCFETLVGKLDAGGLEYYLMGDINVNLAAPHSDNNSRLLTSIIDLYGLHQLICEPTRVSKSSSTMIDLIFTNFPNSGGLLRRLSYRHQRS